MRRRDIKAKRKIYQKITQIERGIEIEEFNNFAKVLSEFKQQQSKMINKEQIKTLFGSIVEDLR